MPLIFAGGEPDDFPYRSGETWTTTTTYYRTGYARGALSVQSANFIHSDSFTPQTTFWATARIYLTSTPNTGYWFMQLCDDTNMRLAIRGNGSVLVLSKYGASETVLVTGTTAISSGQQVKIDIKVSNYGTAGGNIKVYWNGVEHLNYDGDASAGTGSTAINSIKFAGPSSGYVTYVSEVIVHTDDTRSMGLVTHTPNAVGDTAAWTGTYTDVDDIGYPITTDVAASTTADQEVNFALSDLPAGTWIIKSVQVQAYMTKGTGTPSSIALGIKSATGGTSYVGPDQQLDMGWALKKQIFDTNPTTSSDWTQADINPLLIHLKSRT